MEKNCLLDTDEVHTGIDRGDIDTVIVAFTDMQGRLQGKMVHAKFFLSEVLGHGTHACGYLLAVDTDMKPKRGYELTSWEAGYGDMVLMPDLATIRRLSYLERTVIIQADLVTNEGAAVAVAPRTILKAQVERAWALGLAPFAGTELEFILYQNSYEDANRRDHRGLTPLNHHNVDYSVLGSMRAEPILRDIRNAMYESGMAVESSKGECNFGQHEITFRYDDAIVTADNHALYKMSAKHIAEQHGKSITFMAKPNHREGSSCHIHMSLRRLDGSLAFWENGARSPLYDHFIAGVIATMRDMTLFFAPNINSYKRFVTGSFAPTTVTWGADNRTCAVRLVGSGRSARLEHRVPGADANPYLALAAVLAGGLTGIEKGLRPPRATEGNAYASDAERVPSTMTEARTFFARSEHVRAAFGEQVQRHYTRYADIELEQFHAAVTDWEVQRGFERH